MLPAGLRFVIRGLPRAVSHSALTLDAPPCKPRARGTRDCHQDAGRKGACAQKAAPTEGMALHTSTPCPEPDAPGAGLRKRPGSASQGVSRPWASLPRECRCLCQGPTLEGIPLPPTPSTDRTGAGGQRERAKGVQEGCLEERARNSPQEGRGWAWWVGCCSSAAGSRPQGSADSWPFWRQQWPAFKFQLSQPEWPRA